jgi:hypothetical protein
MQCHICCNCSHCAAFAVAIVVITPRFAVAIVVITPRFAVAIMVITPHIVSQAVLSCHIWCRRWCHCAAFGVVVTVIMLRMVSRMLSLDCVVLWLWSPCRVRCQQCMQLQGACQHQHACLTTRCAIVTVGRGACGPSRERAAMSLGKEVEGNDLAAEGEVSKKKSE